MLFLLAVAVNGLTKVRVCIKEAADDTLSARNHKGFVQNKERWPYICCTMSLFQVCVLVCISTVYHCLNS